MIKKVILVIIIIIIALASIKVITVGYSFTRNILNHKRILTNPETIEEKLYFYEHDKVSSDIFLNNGFYAVYYITDTIESAWNTCDEEISDICTYYRVRPGRYWYIDTYKGEKQEYPYDADGDFVSKYAIVFDVDQGEVMLYDNRENVFDHYIDGYRDTESPLLLEVSLEEFNSFYSDSNNSSDYPLVDGVIRDIVEVVDLEIGSRNNPK